MVVGFAERHEVVPLVAQRLVFGEGHDVVDDGGESDAVFAFAVGVGAELGVAELSPASAPGFAFDLAFPGGPALAWLALRCGLAASGAYARR